jgi:hypothetical protein
MSQWYRHHWGCWLLGVVRFALQYGMCVASFEWTRYAVPSCTHLVCTVGQGWPLLNWLGINLLWILDRRGVVQVWFRGVVQLLSPLLMSS